MGSGCESRKNMKLLAIDLSAECGSLAIVESGVTLFEKEWPAEVVRRRPVFSDLNDLTAEVGVEFGRIDRFVVGVGPGSFSGLRMSVALICALALPDNRPVTAVSSARASAAAVFRATGADSVAVLGDARRGDLWVGCFERADGRVERVGEWCVTRPEGLPEAAKRPGTVWISPDAGRLQAVLAACCPPGVSLIDEAPLSRAVMAARLAEELVERGVEGEPPVPIYVHPAVSIAPRYA